MATLFADRCALQPILALAAVLSMPLAGCGRSPEPVASQAAPPAPPAAAPAADVPDDAAKVQPLARGATVAAFSVKRADGTDYRFDPASRSAPAVVIFYRGGWCPYCNVHLGQLKAAEATLRERGYEVLFMSSDRPQILMSSLKDDIEQEVANYTLLSDSDATAARAFRVAFRVDPATVEQYRGYGIDLESTQGNTQHILPVPAVFVVDRSGVIQFAHFNPDYKTRLAAADLLAAAP